jgi:hypothetical protein
MQLLLQVVVPLTLPPAPIIPRPYTSTAHLPTPYVHRLPFQFNMSLYAAEFVAGEYPSGPPGEATWPTFLQVPAPSCQVWHSHASFRLVGIDCPNFRRGTVPQCRRHQMPPALPPSTALASLTFQTTQFFRFVVVEIHIVDHEALL